MTINGIDISTLKSRVLKRTIVPASKTILYEFLSDKALNPVKTAETGYQYKNMEITITISAVTEIELETLKGRITKLFSECVITFEDIPSLVYTGFLSGDTEYEPISNLMGNLSVKLLVLMHGEEVSEVLENTKVIAVGGTCETPCIIEITPSISMMSLQIDGIARDKITGKNEPIVINNLIKDTKIVIDGEQCIVMQNGSNKFQDCDMWSFPSLIPGSNTITLSSECNMQIKFKPRYI